MLSNTTNLFVTDWMGLFNLWDLPLNLFCKNMNGFYASTNKIVYFLPAVLSDELGMYTKNKGKVSNKRKYYTIIETKRTAPFEA